MTERWIVVQTQPRREQWAAENVDRLGYQFYLPRIQVTRQRGRLKLFQVEPMFPRHLFVRSDNGTWRGLAGCWGVTGVIMCGQAPGALPVREIEQLRALEDMDGYVVLPVTVRFAVGDEVRVSSGPMAGFTGIYQGDVARDRVKILLSVLGRKTQVMVAGSSVELA